MNYNNFTVLIDIKLLDIVYAEEEICEESDRIYIKYKDVIILSTSNGCVDLGGIGDFQLLSKRISSIEFGKDENCILINLEKKLCIGIFIESNKNIISIIKQE
jgi:hypothetical protein